MYTRVTLAYNAFRLDPYGPARPSSPDGAEAFAYLLVLGLIWLLLRPNVPTSSPTSFTRPHPRRPSALDTEMIGSLAYTRLLFGLVAAPGAVPHT
jgi:hypothetical protein